MELINYPHELVKEDQNNFEDVYDGEHYKQKLNFLGNKNVLSFQVNIDGVALFKSSKYSVWPIYMKINELPPKIRILKRYRILAGLWFNKSKPQMNTFLEPFVASMIELRDKGFVVDYNNQKITVKATLLSGVFDLPAKCIIQDTIQFNGRYGCGFCEEEGKSISTDKGGHVMVFPKTDLELFAPSRTQESVIAQATIALEQNNPVKGIKGFGQLGYLADFDAVWSCPVDYMHGLLGVVKLLMSLWFDTCHSSADWYLGKYSTLIDDRMVSIKPPSEISRTPRGIAEHRNFFKANEYRNWLLYYSIPVLSGILPSKFYNHMLLLVKGAYLLLQKSISKDDLKEAEMLFYSFTFLHDSLYGERYCTSNVHHLLHIAECVRLHGPMWSSLSAFDFENWNGDFKYLFHGTQHVDTQIMNSITLMQALPEFAEKLDFGSEEYLFYTRLTKEGRVFSKGKSVLDGIRIFGTRKNEDAIPKEHLTSMIQLSGFSKEVAYRLAFKGMILQSRKYKRCTKRNNYTILAKCNLQRIVAFIEYFVIAEEPHGKTCYAVIRRLSLAQESDIELSISNPLSHIKRYTKQLDDEVLLVPVKCILEKLLCIEMPEIFYICSFPNGYEKD